MLNKDQMPVGKS